MSKKYIVFDIETTGLEPWKDSKVTCICAKDSDGNSLSAYGASEKITIRDFILWIKERPDYILISHNGLAFDIPFIIARAYINNIYIPEVVKDTLNNREHFDTMKIINKWLSLNDLGNLFGCGVKSGDGLRAVQLAMSEQWLDLKKYCMQDVELIEEVYKRFQKLREKNQFESQ